MEIPILSLLVFSPIAFALGVWLFGGEDHNKTRLIALSGTAWSFILAVIGIGGRFDMANPGIQFQEKGVWIKSIHVNYHLGVDGLSLAMVLLTTFIAAMVVIGSWQRTHNIRNFYALILLEEFGLLGVFTALDFFHWFIFWEFTLIPMFFLIKLFGHEARTSAAYKFFLYTMVGSVFLLLGFQFIYLATGSWSFPELANLASRGVLVEKLQGRWEEIKDSSAILSACSSGGSCGSEGLLGGLPGKLRACLGFPPMTIGVVICLFVMAGFAVKVPLWPFHTWLPDAYTQAPTAGSILLTALMSKMGVYGFLRIVLPLFHDQIQSMLTPLIWMSLASILLGALAAFAQRDLKTLVSYSSLSHLGYCMLGIFIATAVAQTREDRILALNGVIFQMVAHGLSAAGLFYFVGLLEKRSEAMHGPGFRAIDARAIETYGGIRKSVPVFAGLMGITIFASLGLPGLCGFVGEFMIFKGSFSGTALMWYFVALAALGLLLTAIYLLTMAQKLFFGPQDPKWDALPDLKGREFLVSVPLVAAMFLIGIFPELVINLSNATVTRLAGIFG